MAHDEGTGNDQEEAPREQRPGLTREEDDELRRLAFMARFGSLTWEAQERIASLRRRDRRKQIRLPRAGEPDPVTPEALHRVIPPSQRPKDDEELACSGENPGPDAPAT